MFGKFALFGKTTSFSLDPFGLWPEARSRVEGLGGTEPAAQEDAVFHTAYTSFDPGPMVVDIAFDGLEATHGQMVLHTVTLPDEGGEGKVQTTTHFDLARFAADGGRHRLPIMVKPDHAYAFMARVLGDTDARAGGLTVKTDQHADGPAFARKLAAARAAMPPSRATPDGLVVDQPATLADPRSQMCTAAQFDEPDYERWLGLMHRPKHRHRKQWEHVWICRVLEHWGSLVPEARGLGFGCGVEPLPAVFAAHGARILATDLGAEDRRARRWQETAQHLLSVEALNDPAVYPPERFFEQVDVAAVDMNAIPATLVDYDFCWSSCSLEHLGSIAAGLTFIERSLDTLKPGGVAVHTTELNLTSDTHTVRRGGTVLYRRSDIEAFATRMRGLGHEVLPITWDQGDQPEDQIVDVAPYAADVHFKLALSRYVTTSFGLAIRKAG